MPELENTPNSNDNPLGKTDGLVFDVDDSFSYDGNSDFVLDEDGNWVENDTNSPETTTDQQTNSDNKFGDMPIIFAEYAIAGIRSGDLLEHPEEAALYKEWLDSLDENTKLIINERKRAQGRYEVVRDTLLKSSPFLLEGKLSAEQAEKLGSEKYVLGVNQSQAFSIDDAKNYLKEDNGIGLGIYGLDQRFLLLDENSTATDAEYTERVMVGGYYQNSNIGRFIVAVPMGDTEGGAVQDAVTKADAIADFTQQTNEAGGRSVSPKYIAGFVDNNGRYYENRNFCETNQPLFDEAEQGSGAKIEARKTRENLTQDFAKFKPLIDDLKARLENHDDSRNDEAYLGGGGGSRAFTLVLDGKEYAVVVPADTREAWKPNSAVEARVQPLLAVQGVSHLEQIAAVSDEYGITISERMPGVTLGSEMPLTAIGSISQEQVDTLVDTILIGCERGIVFDPKLSNFLYDPAEGFGIIDFQSPDTYGVVARDVVSQVSDIVTKINTMATGKSLPTTFEDFAYIGDGSMIRLGFLRKMRTAVSLKLSGDGLATVLDRVDGLIRDLEGEMPQLSDEEYINTTIQANLDEIHKQSELTRKRLGGWGAL